jgi:chromosome segregation ATPase
MATNELWDEAYSTNRRLRNLASDVHRMESDIGALHSDLSTLDRRTELLVERDQHQGQQIAKLHERADALGTAISLLDDHRFRIQDRLDTIEEALHSLDRRLQALSRQVFDAKASTPCRTVDDCDQPFVGNCTDCPLTDQVSD